MHGARCALFIFGGCVVVCVASFDVMVMQPFDGLRAVGDMVATCWGGFVFVIGVLGLL
jgi:hypothetical protein